ncbi:MAG: hypothetical protein ACRCXC_09225 [Legionella sp.]
MKRKHPSSQEPEYQGKKLKQSDSQLNQTDNEEVQQKVNDQFLDIFDIEIKRI